MTHASLARQPVERLSIGQVLERLNREFSDLTLSKLRFLEERGLVTPERTEKGYRKFSQAHIERIRLILTLQRDHYLPLKVIAQFLDELDQGKNPELPGGAGTAASILRPSNVLSRPEMIRQSGATTRLFADAVAAGLLPAVEVYPQDALHQLRAIVELAKRGITPNHLRALRVSAERDSELIRQASANRGRGEGSPANREDMLELADLFDAVRGGVLRRRLVG